MMKKYDILKNGIPLKTIDGSKIRLSPHSKDSRIFQLRAILTKYRELSSNKVFRVEDRRKQESMLPEEKHKDWKPKIEFESEMQKSYGIFSDLMWSFTTKTDKNRSDTA
jgi:hypothetical protein